MDASTAVCLLKQFRHEAGRYSNPRPMGVNFIRIRRVYKAHHTGLLPETSPGSETILVERTNSGPLRREASEDERSVLAILSPIGVRMEVVCRENARWRYSRSDPKERGAGPLLRYYPR